MPDDQETLCDRAVHLVLLHPETEAGEVVACMNCGQPFEIQRNGPEIIATALPPRHGLAIRSMLLPGFVWTYSLN